MRILSVALILAVVPFASAGDSELPPYEVPEALRDDSPEQADLVASLTREVLDERIRGSQEAWRALASLGRPAVPATVRALPGASWYARTLLMAALAESGVREAEPVLLLGARDPSWAVREMAVHGFGLAREAAVEEPLLAALSDPSWRVRATAASALRRQATRGRADRDRAVSALLKRIGDPAEDPDVRRVMLYELDLLDAPEAAEVFLAGYENEEDDRTREICFLALTRLLTAREALVGAMENALDRSEEAIFLEAAEKYAELTGSRILENEAHKGRLLRLLRTHHSLQVGKVFEEIGPDAVPVLLEELERFWTRRRVPAQADLTQTILDLVEKILNEDAAEVLDRIIREWEAAEPARRYALYLARLYHAKALVSTFEEIFTKEGVRGIQASLLEGIAAAGSGNLPRFLELAVLSGNLELQRAARRILESRPEIDLRDALAEALTAENRNAPVARDFIQLLVKRDKAKAYEQASRLLAHAEPDFRVVGADWIRFLAPPEEILAKLAAAYDREDGLVRDADAPPQEEEDRIREERRQVVRAILQSARATAKSAALPLLTKAAGDDDPVVREIALRETARLEDPAALRLAIEVLAGETEPTVAHEARKAILGHDTAEARAKLAEWLTGEDPLARRSALRALDTVEDAAIPDLVLTALSEGRWEPAARVTAVQALATRQDPDHLDVLLRLATGDKDPDVRSSAIEAVEQIGSARAAPALLRLLPREGEDLRDLGTSERELAAQAIQTLGWLDAPDAVAPLLALLRREWPLALVDRTEDRRHFDAAALIVTALGRIGDERALPIVLELLFSADLYRPFALLGSSPPKDERNLLGVLLAALVRFPDNAVGREGATLLTRLRESGEVYRIDESYLLYLANQLTDPRTEVGRPQPRRTLAGMLYRLVLDVAPRESAVDQTALSMLGARAADERRFDEAAAHHARYSEIVRLNDPRWFTEREDVILARSDFLTGMAMMLAGREEEGLARYRNGRERDPEDDEILNLFAWWLAETGLHLEEALEAGQAGGRRAGSDPNVIDTIGWTLHRLGRHREAVLRLRKAAELDEDRAASDLRKADPLILYHLSAAEAKAGLTEIAANHLLHVLTRMDDTYATRAAASPDFESLRREGLLEEVFRRARLALRQ